MWLPNFSFSKSLCLGPAEVPVTEGGSFLSQCFGEPPTDSGSSSGGGCDCGSSGGSGRDIASDRHDMNGEAMLPKVIGGTHQITDLVSSI